MDSFAIRWGAPRNTTVRHIPEYRPDCPRTTIPPRMSLPIRFGLRMLSPLNICPPDVLCSKPTLPSAQSPRAIMACTKTLALTATSPSTTAPLSSSTTAPLSSSTTPLSSSTTTAPLSSSTTAPLSSSTTTAQMSTSSAPVAVRSGKVDPSTNLANIGEKTEEILITITHFCDTCERDFAAEIDLAQHIKIHKKCDEVGCGFEGLRQAIFNHKAHQHVSGFASKIWELNSDEKVQQWREDRKRNYLKLMTDRSRAVQVAKIFPTLIGQTQRGRTTPFKTYMCGRNIMPHAYLHRSENVDREKSKEYSERDKESSPRRSHRYSLGPTKRKWRCCDSPSRSRHSCSPTKSGRKRRHSPPRSDHRSPTRSTHRHTSSESSDQSHSHSPENGRHWYCYSTTKSKNSPSSPSRNHSPSRSDHSSSSSPTRSTRRHSCSLESNDQKHSHSPARNRRRFCYTSSTSRRHQKRSHRHSQSSSLDQRHSRSTSRDQRHSRSTGRDQRHNRSTSRDQRHSRSASRDQRHSRSTSRDQRHIRSSSSDHKHSRGSSSEHKHSRSSSRDHRHSSRPAHKRSYRSESSYQRHIHNSARKSKSRSCSPMYQRVINQVSSRSRSPKANQPEGSIKDYTLFKEWSSSITRKPNVLGLPSKYEAARTMLQGEGTSTSRPNEDWNVSCSFGTNEGEIMCDSRTMQSSLKYMASLSKELFQASSPKVDPMSRLVALQVLKHSSGNNTSHIQALKEQVFTELIEDEFGDRYAENFKKVLQNRSSLPNCEKLPSTSVETVKLQHLDEFVHHRSTIASIDDYNQNQHKLMSGVNTTQQVPAAQEFAIGYKKTSGRLFQKEQGTGISRHCTDNTVVSTCSKQMMGLDKLDDWQRKWIAKQLSSLVAVTGQLEVSEEVLNLLIEESFTLINKLPESSVAKNFEFCSVDGELYSDQWTRRDCSAGPRYLSSDQISEVPSNITHYTENSSRVPESAAAASVPVKLPLQRYVPSEHFSPSPSTISNCVERIGSEKRHKTFTASPLSATSSSHVSELVQEADDYEEWLNSQLLVSK